MTQDYASLKAQGNAALSDQNFELAEDYFQKALVSAPENPESYNNLGRLYDFQRQDEKAEQFYLKANELDHSYLIAMYNLGVFYLKRYRFALCIEWHQKLLKLIPEDSKLLPAVFQCLGESYDYLDDHASSEIYYRKGLELAPENLHLQLGLACQLIYRNENDAAFEILIKLVDIATPDLLHDTYYWLGVIYHSRKDFKRAIKYFNQHILITHDPSNAYRYLAEIYESYKTCESYKKGIKILKNNIENGTVTFEDYYNLGRLYSFIKEYELSIQSFNSSIALQENRQSYYQRARVLFVISNYLESIESVKKAISRDSTHPKYYALLGFSYYKLNDFETALEAFMQSLDLEGFALEDCRGDYEMIAYLIQEEGSHEHLIPLFMAAHERVEAKFSMQDSK